MSTKDQQSIAKYKDPVGGALHAPLPPLINDTIAAISTAPGTGAIAIVRLSGPAAWKIITQIFTKNKNGTTDQVNLEKNFAAHGFIRDANGIYLDEVVVVPFRAPHSYTGEDLVEISCHGGQVVTREILSLCVEDGARLANRGEFTQRAFISGRLDLTQAESVLDLIQAKTKKQSRMAVSALSGIIGNEIKSIRAELIRTLTRVIAGIDFPEEVGDMSFDDLSEIIERNTAKLEQLAKTTRSGKYLRDGVRLAIVGKPNVGKSSLLNQLLNFERAIVTDIPGTTRDSLEEMLDINGIPVILVDTAGIRATEDAVEKIGIERTRIAIEEADLVLLLTDATSVLTEADQPILKILGDKPFILTINKIDLNPNFDMSCLKKDMAHNNCLNLLSISALKGTGIDKLNEAIESWATHDANADLGASLNTRQGELCQAAVRALKFVSETIRNQMPQDCLATDLKLAIDNLSEICGESVSEEVIQQVFANFCIGK